ncbi:hypothetical protein CGRA01v4_00297 [Colletotrichum graminicola]|nr:hypothetical protein CGRA01v4_00297 [Colletotrichum graminicola]
MPQPFSFPVSTVTTYYPRKLAPFPSSYANCDLTTGESRLARCSCSPQVLTMSPTMTRGRPGELLLSPCLVAGVPR